MTHAAQGGLRRHLWVSGLMLVLIGASLRSGVPVAEASQGPCPEGSVLNVVAHQDDDLLFAGETVASDIKSGKCVRTVYVTAGNDSLPSWYWLSREAGVRAAYAQLAETANQWTTSSVSVAGNATTLAILTGRPEVSLQFLRLPDGQMDGSGDTSTMGYSLQKLMQDLIPSISTVDGSSTYTRAQLVSTLQSIMHSTGADEINTLDYVHHFGEGDHSDHYAVAQLTQLAQAGYSPAHTFTGYQGYGIAAYPSNITGEALVTKSEAFYTYGSFDWKTCHSAETCANRPEGSWLSRQYTVGNEVPPDPPPPGPPVDDDTNAAPQATVTASSENRADQQVAGSAVDGVADGYPGDYTKEWATTGGMAGSWLNLAWSEPVTLDRVVLFDRPNLDDQIVAGTLTFDDGTTVTVAALANDGAATTVTFPAVETSSLRLTITAVAPTTRNIGLAEMQAFTQEAAPPTSSQVNRAPNASVLASTENWADQQVAGSAVDGVADGYPGDYTKEWATTGGMAGSWLNLAWSEPVTLDRVVLFDRPNLDDQIVAGTLTFDDGTTVTVPALANDGAATTVTFPAVETSSLRLTITAVAPTTRNIGLAEIETWGPAGE